MTVKASGRSGLILAAGFMVCFASCPSQAATDTDDAAASSKSEDAGAPVALNQHGKRGSHHHRKNHRHRESINPAEPAGVAAADAANSPAIAPSIANANAQLASTDTSTSTAARAMSVRANEILQNPPDRSTETQSAAADSQVVSADQLNDVDRALHESKPPALALASAEPSAAPAPPMMAVGSTESSTWDQTSLIGKIFIGFGAILTIASAARMFMA